MIIGLSGYAQSGKDTVAGMLIGLYGYDNRAFASKIKELLIEINPNLNNYFDLKGAVDAVSWDQAKLSVEVRRLLQDLGVGARKIFGEDFWVSQTLSGVNPGDKIVVTDVRYPNEAQAVKDLGGVIWRIQRPGISAVNDHPSESAMDDWDYDKVIVNNSGLDGLKSQIATIMEEINVL
jgi:hypothetical protein